MYYYICTWRGSSKWELAGFRILPRNTTKYPHYLSLFNYGKAYCPAVASERSIIRVQIRVCSIVLSITYSYRYGQLLLRTHWSRYISAHWVPLAVVLVDPLYTVFYCYTWTCAHQYASLDSISMISVMRTVSVPQRTRIVQADQVSISQGDCTADQILKGCTNPGANFI